MTTIVIHDILVIIHSYSDKENMKSLWMVSKIFNDYKKIHINCIVRNFRALYDTYHEYYYKE